jgi:hypothetical protein
MVLGLWGGGQDEGETYQRQTLASTLLKSIERIFLFFVWPGLALIQLPGNRVSSGLIETQLNHHLEHKLLLKSART